ncbi:MAG: hypothetical protein ACK5NF_01285 [Bacilli bacterium]
MIDNYYDEIILTIKKLINSEKRDEAFVILKDELSKPYIPKEAEKVFEQIFEDEFVNSKAVTLNQLSLEDARRGLCELNISNIVHNFYTLNLRLLSDDILFYFKNSDDYITMSMLIYNLISQGINLNFELTKFGVTKVYNTLDLSVLDEDLVSKYYELFENEFMKTPVYIKYCKDILNYYLLITFPFKFDIDFELFEEVVIYVKKISGISEFCNNVEFLKIIEYGE